MHLALKQMQEKFSPASVWNETWHWTLTHSALKSERSPPPTVRHSQLSLRMLVVDSCCARFVCVCAGLLLPMWLSLSFYLLDMRHFSAFLYFCFPSCWVFVAFWFFCQTCKIVFANMFVLTYLKCQNYCNYKIFSPLINLTIIFLIVWYKFGTVKNAHHISRVQPTVENPNIFC